MKIIKTHSHIAGYFEFRESAGYNIINKLCRAIMKDWYCVCGHFLGTELFKNKYKKGVYEFIRV